MEYTRNSDPEYYDKNRYRANCGSYALRLCEWYDPETYLMDQTDTIYVEEWIEHMALNGYDNYDITDFYIDILVEKFTFHKIAKETYAAHYDNWIVIAPPKIAINSLTS